MIELYHNAMSVCAQKVRVVLADKAVEYISHALDIRAGETHTSEYLALNPKGVVPTLLVDGVPIIESTIICEYLEDAFPEPCLSPATPLARSEMRQWTIRPDAGMHQAFGLLSFAVAFRQQNSAEQMKTRKAGESTELLKSVIADGLDSRELLIRIDVVRTMLEDMDRRLSVRPWLIGDAYSLADIAMLPYICRLRDLGQDWLWGAGQFSAIAPWLERCAARPGYSGIADFLNPAYLNLMGAAGATSKPRLRELLSR
jgi:glutathione S-transferase